MLSGRLGFSYVGRWGFVVGGNEGSCYFVCWRYTGINKMTLCDLCHNSYDSSGYVIIKSVLLRCQLSMLYKNSCDSI